MPLVNATAPMRMTARSGWDDQIRVFLHPHYANYIMRLIISLILLTLVPPTFSKEINIKDSRIWSIESAKNMRKWIIIHNLETGKQTGIYHIEIIGRKKGNPTWKIDHLVRHMAITENALKASIKNPLTTGDVYPESFQSAFNSWSKENNGKGGFVCEKSILDCIK